MAQFYQLVHGGGSTTVTLDELHHMYPNGHIQYIINDDETGAIQYQNQQMIGIDQQTGATVQLGSYPHQQQIVVENSPHQPGVYVIETIDPSAQTTIEVQQPTVPQAQPPQQQEILTAQPQPTQFVAQQQTDVTQEVFYNRQPANNGLVVEAGVHLPTSVSPQQVATGSPLRSRHPSGGTPAYQRVKQGQAQVQQQQQQIPQVAQVAQVVQHVQQAAQQQLLTHQQSIIQLADGRKVSLVQWRRMQEQQHQLASAAAKTAEQGITVIPSPARPQQPAVRHTTPRQTTPRQPARQRQTARPRQNNRQNNRQNKTTAMNETVLTTLMQQRQQQQQQQHEQTQQRIQQQEPLRQQQPQQAPQILQQQVPVHQQQIQRPQQQIPRQQQISQPQQQQPLPLVQQQQQLPPQPQPQAHQQQMQPTQQQMQPPQQQMQPSQQHLQSPQQLQQQIQHQQPHALSPSVQRPMQVRQEYAGPKRLYAPAKARVRSHNTLIANNTVQAIASPTTGGNHQSLLQQHDSSNVISVSDQLNSALAPAVVEEQPTQVKLEEPVNTTQVLFLLPNGQQRFIKFDVPPHAQDFCLKDLLSQVGLKEGESNVTIMSCGGLPPEQPVVLQAEEEVQVKQEPVEQPQTPFNGTVLVSGNVLTASVAVSTTTQEQQQLVESWLY